MIFKKVLKLSKCNFDDFLYDKTFNILFIDCYFYAYIKLAIVIGRVRVQI